MREIGILKLEKKLLQEKIDEFLEITNDQPDEYWTKENYLADYEGKWKYSVYLYSEMKIIGFIIASVKSESTLHIHKFMIHKNFRGKGYGKLLLEKFVDNVKKFYKSITLKVAANNKNAISFYTRNDFEFVKETGNNYLELKKKLV